MSSPLIPTYAETKRQYPAEGRRRWRLRVAQQFWTAVGSGGSTSLTLVNQLQARHPLDVLPEAASISESDTDPDPLDGVTRDAPELGLIVRTDFSDEASWTTFCARLQDGEKELTLNSVDEDKAKDTGNDVGGGDQDSSDDEDGGQDASRAIFHIINPSSQQERELLTNISNLTVLRLFNDVDIRPSPNPQGAKRIKPPNRLVDYNGWQEYYQGKNVWVYDIKSNTDQCVRVVSQSGDMYGTATGDSWRARVSHVCELQVNLSSGAIKIDFGGFDRWDFNERRRNVMEAEGE